MLVKALTGGPRYMAWVTVLALLALAGVATYYHQYQVGLGLTGMGRDVSWGMYIGQFTFLVGVAASAVMLVIPFYLHDYKTFGKTVVFGEILAVASVTMCILFIMADMGMPRRVLYVMLHPRPNSILFWDASVLTGYFALNLLISSVSLYYQARGDHHPKWLNPFIYLSIPWAISIHTVTAFLYAGLPGREYWLTAIMAPRFLASAFAAGPAFLLLTLLVVRKVSRFDPGQAAIRTLAKIITYAMVTNVFFLILEVFTAFYSQIPGHMTPFVYLFMGIDGHNLLVPFMRLSVLLAVVSVILLVPSRSRNNPTTLVIACVCLFISLLLEKGFGLIVAGFVPNPLERVVEYWPSGPELTIVAGVWATGLLILTLGYKIAIAVREHELDTQPRVQEA